MKRLLLPAVLALFQLHVCAQDIPQLMTEAQRAYLRGDTQAAKEKFQIIIARDPGNQPAQNYLRMIDALERSEGPGSQLARQLDSLILPKVELRGATFGNALEFFKQQADKISQGKTKVNFVVSLPQEFVESKRVTLNLTDVPFAEALRYLGDLADVSFSIQKYAVLVKPKGTPPPTEAPSPQ